MNRFRKYSAFSFLLTLFFSPSVYATNDKTLHFAVSSVAGYLAETTIHQAVTSDTKRIFYGTLLGTVPGLIKEILDSNEENNEFSGDDMLANIAGAFTGSFIANKVNRRLMVNLHKNGDAYFVGIIYRD